MFLTFLSSADLSEPLMYDIYGFGRGHWLSQGATIPLSPFYSLWFMNTEEEKERNLEEIKL